MDKFSDLLPILIGIVVFAIKIISDANKKKTQNQKGKQSPKQRGGNKSYQDYAKPKQSYKQPAPYKIPDFSHNSNPMENLEEYNSNYTLDTQDVPDIDYDKMDSNILLHDSETILHKAPARVDRPTNKKLIAITGKIKDKSAIKEMIILSEILKKPKALRKW